MRFDLVKGFCFIASAGCLLVGYSLAGFFIVFLILLAMYFLWLFVRNQPGDFPISLILLIYLALAVYGLLAGLIPALMIIGCIFALASWDLSLLGTDRNGDPSQSKDVLFEKLHLKALAIASVFGLLVSILSLNIHLHLSFGLIGGLLVLVALGLHLSLRFHPK